ncbi:fatty-acid peroxygenase [Halobacillus andaensis]|uniref:Fatty-acid peroxygenase n=1 Tax=Halobacillus andaensis TaxID=1176239 RepID=A0A917B8M6_HALAA|nr:cytochrome P450 [Halobacillus andaensis]MBP2005851.1 fatty-acid peroxygenase [Halobacillus andaensis]GGF25586.1 fatty-acid peroxygenase [Halobacillus andaensis]
MKKIPRDQRLDQSINVLRQGYRFLPKRFERLHTDIFQTTLLAEKVICVTGEEGARLFYDKEKFQRKGALPKRIEKSLFGENAIQGMDGHPHEHRKLLFMSLMTPDHLERLSNITTAQWRKKAYEWTPDGEIILFEEAKEVLCRAACEWAGIPLEENEVTERAEQLWSMIDAFGAVGPRHWKGRKARAESEKWMKKKILDVREQRLQAPGDSALYQMASHKDIEGNPLDPQIAAVELLNVIRPTVAVATYVAFGALALHDDEEQEGKVREAESPYIEMFTQEIRRLFPFVPFLGARVRRDFIWNGFHFKKGRLVLLDIHGTDHDSRLWEDPHKFKPERFQEWKGGLFDLIPQGGGEHYTGHRCPGEWITIETIKSSMRFLTNDLEYDVPSQDLSYSLTRMPSLPKSGVVLTNVRIKP